MFSTDSDSPNVTWELDGPNLLRINIPRENITLEPGIHRIVLNVQDKEGKILTPIDTTLTVVLNQSTFKLNV